jgi:hypothetical protein
MNKTIQFLTIFILLCLLALPIGVARAAPLQPAELDSPSSPQQNQPDFELVFGGSYTLDEGETLNSNLVVFGGSARLESGSQVNGDILLFGGSLNVGGTVAGDIVVFGGQVTLLASAVVRGDVSLVGGNLSQVPGAQVQGEVSEGTFGPVNFNFPEGFRFGSYEGIPWQFFHTVRNPWVDALWFLFQSLIWALVAALVALIAPRPTGRVAMAAVSQPLASGGVGCLTVIVVPVVIIVMAITILCIPLSLLVALILAAAWVFGLIALGTEIGNRMATMFKREWPLPVAAGLGTFLLTVVTNGATRLVPCVFWILPLLVGVLGLGAVLLTRFGRHDYPEYASPVPDPQQIAPASPAAVAELPVQPSDESEPPIE